jgi:glycosyltransferase involved in cell wall biosynthesis
MIATKRFNILFISSWFPNKLEPTNGNFVQRHAEAVALMHHVEVLHAIGNKNQKETYHFDEQNIHGIKTLIVYYKNSNNPLLNFYRRMKAYQMGFQKMTPPDLVHGNILHNNLFFAVYLKKLYKIPFVVTDHWTALQEDYRLQTPKMVLWAAKTIAKEAEYILPVSENLSKSLESLGIKTPKKTISNVVDTDVFQLKTKHQPFRFLHVSSLIPRKNPDKIITVAKQLHDLGYNFQLEIGGDGDYLSLQKQIDSLHAQNYIHTFGEISYTSVAEKMKNSDCFVLFSENENLPCVLLEALSAGNLVISTQVGGVQEIVKEKLGRLVARGNEDQLLQAMKEVMEHPDRFETPENRRETVVSHYSKKAIAEQFNEIYQKIK